MTLSALNAAARLRLEHPQNAPVTFLQELETVSVVLGSHSEFLAYYKKLDTDFVYDGTSGLYLVGVGCSHVDLRASLFRYYGGEGLNNFERADQYILQGKGMFKSRAGHKIYCGADFIVPSELRPIFRDIEVLT